MLKYMAEARTVDIYKAKQRLGYKPLVGIKEGIRQRQSPQLFSTRSNLNVNSQARYANHNNLIDKFNASNNHIVKSNFGHLGNQNDACDRAFR
jgi:hypothetical protein